MKIDAKKQDWDRIEYDPIGLLSELSEVELGFILRSLSLSQRREFNQRWRQWAHKGQRPDESEWRIWMILAGRGFGKTRAGAEWLSALARSDGTLRFALVGGTIEDVRKVMIEGESGLLSVAHVGETIDWNPHRGEVTFHSGAVAHVYSAESFEKLRGPEHHHAWCDELGKWNNADAAWDNLMLGLRLGEKPRVLVTTTPRTIGLLRRLVEQDGVILCGGATRDNHNLPPDFVETVTALYGGTRWGRQELEGELIEDVAGALWSRDLLERQRVLRPSTGSGSQDERLFKRIVIGVDPPVSVGGDACGIVAVGLGRDDKAYVLADHTIKGASPEGWARAVAAAVEAWGADRVVAEDNQGGNMVESTLRAADLAMPVKRVHASRGKSARAEPVAALYEAKRAFHVGGLPELEDEMCGLVVGGGYEGPGRSPDRADALVWAMTELMLGKSKAGPRISLL